MKNKFLNDLGEDGPRTPLQTYLPGARFNAPPPPDPPVVEIGSAIPSSPRFLISSSEKALTLYTLTSVLIFSTLFSVHLLRCCQGEFV